MNVLQLSEAAETNTSQVSISQLSSFLATQNILGCILYDSTYLQLIRTVLDIVLPELLILAVRDGLLYVLDCPLYCKLF